MIYSDRELTDWWERLSHSSKAEIFERIFDNAADARFLERTKGWEQMYLAGQVISPNALQQLRRWTRG